MLTVAKPSNLCLVQTHSGGKENQLPWHRREFHFLLSVHFLVVMTFSPENVPIIFHHVPIKGTTNNAFSIHMANSHGLLRII